jgi:hypothetical protein
MAMSMIECDLADEDQYAGSLDFHSFCSAGLVSCQYYSYMHVLPIEHEIYSYASKPESTIFSNIRCL